MNNNSSFPKSFKDQDRLLQSKVLYSNKGITPVFALERGKRAILSLSDEYEQRLGMEIESIHGIYKEILANKIEINKGLESMCKISNELRGEAGTFGFRFLTRVADCLFKFIEIVNNNFDHGISDRIMKAIEVHLRSLNLDTKNAQKDVITKEHGQLLDQLHEMRKKFYEFLKK